MRRSQRQSFIVCSAICFSLIFAFQNCAPAKLSGDGTGGTIISGSANGLSTVGTKVDLNRLMSSAAEPTSNIVYPSTALIRESRYSAGNPVMENVILRNDSFDRIEWVQGSTSVVLSNSLNFEPRLFTSDLLGMVFIFGYRGSTPYFLGQMRFENRGSTNLNANSVGAVTVNQKTIFTDALNEGFLVDVEAPSVDVKSIRYTLQPSGEVILNQRALLVNKSRSQSVSVSVSVTDSLNQTFVRQLNFPATLTSPVPSPVATPSPTPMPTPVATPTPAPMATPTPTPTPTPAPVAMPDVVITSINWSPASITERTNVRFAATVKNFGSAPTPAGVTLGVGFFVNGVQVSWSGNHTTSLAPGASVTLVADSGPNGGSSVWVASAGTFAVTAHVDDVNRFAESNDGNNMLNSTIVVGSAPIVHLRTRVNGTSYVDAYSNASGIRLQLWTPYTSVTQNFQYMANNELRVQGKCIAPSGTASGSAIVLADCNGAANQKWIYNASTGEIKSSNGLCADVPNSVTTNGTSINIFTCHGGPNQKWDLVP